MAAPGAADERRQRAHRVVVVAVDDEERVVAGPRLRGGDRVGGADGLLLNGKGERAAGGAPGAAVVARHRLVIGRDDEADVGVAGVGERGEAVVEEGPADSAGAVAGVRERPAIGIIALAPRSRGLRLGRVEIAIRGLTHPRAEAAREDDRPFARSPRRPPGAVARRRSASGHRRRDSIASAVPLTTAVAASTAASVHAP